MPRGQGGDATGRGSSARDGAHPVKRNEMARSLVHRSELGLRDRKVKPSDTLRRGPRRNRRREGLALKGKQPQPEQEGKDHREGIVAHAAKGGVAPLQKADQEYGDEYSADQS